MTEPRPSRKRPNRILETCFKGTRHVLDLAVQAKARVLLASTSEFYGDALVCPQPETYHGNVNPFGPPSCYDEGKRVAEALSYAHRKQQLADVRIARIFNAYGPGRPGRRTCGAQLRGRRAGGNDIEIAGDGTASRCFQYATDCVTGLYMLMESACTEPVNIGCDDETTIGELANMISEIVAKKTRQLPVKICLTPKREDEPFRRQPDVTRAREKLQWSAKVGLSEGLEAIVDWFLRLQNQELRL